MHQHFRDGVMSAPTVICLITVLLMVIMVLQLFQQFYRNRKADAKPIKGQFANHFRPTHVQATNKNSAVKKVVSSPPAMML